MLSYPHLLGFACSSGFSAVHALGSSFSPFDCYQPYTSMSIVHFHPQTSALAVPTARFALIFGRLERTVHHHLLSAVLLNARTKRVALKASSSVTPSSCVRI